jgi:hypothetical protein
MIHEAIILGRNRNLRAVDRLTLLVLAHRSITASGNIVRATLATLAADTGLSKRGLIDSLHRLRDSGLISIEHNGRTNNYRLCVRELLREQRQRPGAGYAPISRRPVRRVHHSSPNGAPDAPITRGRPRLVVVSGTRGTEP